MPSTHRIRVVAHVLFPLGIRLSTWLVLAIFLALGLRDRRFWLAGAAWIGSWEIAYQLSQTTEVLAHWHGRGSWWAAVIVIWTYACGIVLVLAAARRGARPDLRFIAASVIVWAIWIVTGFHVNGHTMRHFDPTAEALNEAAKTLWALAYLTPLLVRPTGRIDLRVRRLVHAQNDRVAREVA